MAYPRWKKILADLWSSKARTILAALSIAVGIFAVGVVTTAYFLVRDAMVLDYENANPRTARIYTESFDESLVKDVAKVPGVTAAQGYFDAWLKGLGADGNLYPVDVTMIESLDALNVDRLVFEGGSRKLSKGEIYMERAGAEGMGLKVGSTIDLKGNDGEVRTLKIVGLVHDVNANPFRFNQKTAAYVTPETMSWLGETNLYNNIAIITDGLHTDINQVREIAERAAGTVKQHGKEVYSVNINNPGQHPAQSIINSVLALMGALAIMSVLLSIFLVINTISALMSQQIRQIGVMKALGAKVGQLICMYLALVEAFGLLALLIGLPLGALVAYGFAHWLLMMLNADMIPFYLPAQSVILQALVGLVVPLVGAVAPVISGARLTVREAISNIGMDSTGSQGWIDRMLASERIQSLRWPSRPLMLSLRNAFRRKSRLILTLITLTLGGAIFISVFSVRDSLYRELDQNYGYYQSDVNIEMNQNQKIDRMVVAVQDIPGVVSGEGWLSSRLNVMHADGVNSDLVLAFAPPSDTKLITPVMIEGRWLLPEDENGLVADNHFLSTRPDVKVNDTVVLRINKQDHLFTVVGIFRLAGNSTIGTVYLNRETLERLSGVGTEMTNSFKVVTTRHDAASQMEVLRRLQTRLDAKDIDAYLQTGSDIIASSRSTLNMLIYLLLFMAVLIAIVGGLGLMGTMGMNGIERTREIGVMRSIGAVNSKIYQLVVAEGMFIGLISWGLGWLVSFPIANLLDRQLGQMLLNVPLVYVFSAQGPIFWLVVVLLLSVLASLMPARNAVRLTIRDILAYE